MITLGPPTSYRHWRGHHVSQPTPDWPYPPYRNEAPGWIPLGYCAPPKGTWQTFRYHLLHGLLMRYPLPSVLAFAWRERHSFDEWDDA